MSTNLNELYESRSFKKESLIYNVTEDILCIMENLGLTKKALAAKLGSKSKSHVSQLLSGTRNMTLGTLSDICHELNAELVVSIKQIDTNEKFIDDTSCPSVTIEQSPKPVLTLIRKPNTDKHYKNNHWLPDEQRVA